MSEKGGLDIAVEIAISRLNEGDREALAVIYNCYGRMIFSVALGITGNYADAEDVLQDTMLQIIKYSHTYKRGTSPRAFVLAMARHRAIDIIRRRKDHIDLNDASLSHIESDESREEADRLISEDVVHLLSALDEGEKQVIILRIYAEMSFAEVAKAMNISVFAAQKRYQRAIKKLKGLSKNCGGDFG